MSEARRKKQLERLGTAEERVSPRTLMIWAGVVVLFAAAWAGGWYYRNHRYDSFAKCLSTKQAKMYGLYWCPHCADQKAMFGKSFQYVPYIECAVKGSKDLMPACQAAGVKLFPAWQFGESTPHSGVYSLEELSDKTGCSLP